MFPQLVVALVLMVVSYLIRPKPPAQPAAKNMTVPTVDPSKEISVVFGTVLKQDPAITWYGDLRVRDTDA